MSELHRKLEESIAYPKHDPRKASAEYRHVHHTLVVELDTPCWICGVKHSQGGKMETHHSELEWAAANGVDLQLIMKDFPKLSDHDKLIDWLDSEGNMLVLCATHHRGARTGIHMITYPAWKLQRWQNDELFVFIVQPK